MNQKVKTVFLDKDGTLIPDIPYNVDPNLITLYDGVIEGLQLLQAEGYKFVVISNQAGVARGYFQVEQLEGVKQKLNALFNSAGVVIENYYFCPHHINGTVAQYSIKCACRKPEPGMLLQAIHELNIDPAQSWMVGDILNDVEAGNRAGCKTILINNGNETEFLGGANRQPTFVASSFLAAAKYICSLSTITS